MLQPFPKERKQLNKVAHWEDTQVHLLYLHHNVAESVYFASWLWTRYFFSKMYKSLSPLNVQAST